MWKPLTGEPYAGDPPVRFGGRGGQKTFPTPIVKVRILLDGTYFRVNDKRERKPGRISIDLNPAKPCPLNYGGEAGIRTLGEVAPTTVFETRKAALK